MNYNPLAVTSFEMVKSIYRGLQYGFSPDQQWKIEKLIYEISNTQNNLKKLLRKIERYENATGFDFTKESQRGVS